MTKKLKISEIKNFKIYRQLMSPLPPYFSPLSYLLHLQHLHKSLSQDVRLGNLEGPQLSLDLDESGISTQLSSSPPNTGRASPTQPTTPAPIQEPMELQVDYWPTMRQSVDGKEKNQTKGQDQGKNSVKSTFRNLQVGWWGDGISVGYLSGSVGLLGHYYLLWKLFF